MKASRAFLFKVITISAVIAFLAVMQSVRGEVPRLFTTTDFTPADFAEAVNHFTRLGEEAAVQELEQLALEGGNYHVFRDKDGKEGFYYPERVGWMCRVLFEGREGQDLRPPKFGVLEFLPPPDLMVTNWPEFPIAKCDSTYFVLWEGCVSVSGDSNLEDVKTYIEYCCHNGTFRQQAITVPSKERALKDLAALKTSAAWKSIKWSYTYNGSVYVLDEGPIWKFIESQPNRMK